MPWAGIAKLDQTKEGGFLILEKQKSSKIFVLLKGKVSVEITIPGEDKIESIAKLGPGNLFGELAVLDVPKRTASVRVVEDCMFLTLGKNDLLELFEKDQAIGYKFMRNLAVTLAERMIFTTKDLGSAIYQILFNEQQHQAATNAANQESKADEQDNDNDNDNEA